MTGWRADFVWSLHGFYGGAGCAAAELVKSEFDLAKCGGYDILKMGQKDSRLSNQEESPGSTEHGSR